MKKAKKVKTTLDSLAGSIDTLTRAVDRKIEGLAQSIDNLAKSAKKGFETQAESLEELARMVADGFADTATKTEVKALEKRMGILEVGQEAIVLRLDNVSYKSEVENLGRRVAVLEKKVGITNK